MQKTTLKHLAKRAKTSTERVEYLWNKSGAIVKSEYDFTEEDVAFWGLRMGITKRMLGIAESVSFSQFIQEQAEPVDMSYEDIKNLIKKDCAQFLSVAAKPLFRGIQARDIENSSIIRRVNGSSNAQVPLFVGAVRPNRKPKDSSELVTSGLNAIHERDVGLPLRTTSLFTTLNESFAMSYGIACAVFPIGEFHYAWSSLIDDPYSIFEDRAMMTDLRRACETVAGEVKSKSKIPFERRLSNRAFIDLIFDNPGSFAEKILECLAIIPGLYTYDSGFSQIPKNHEIMVTCDKYYILYAGDAKKMFNELK